MEISYDPSKLIISPNLKCTLILFVVVSFLPAPTLTVQAVSNNRSNTDTNLTSSDCPTGPQRDLLDRTWCDLDWEFEERETLRSEPREEVM
jgi:hypothetical protein